MQSPARNKHQCILSAGLFSFAWKTITVSWQDGPKSTRAAVLTQHGCPKDCGACWVMYYCTIVYYGRAIPAYYGAFSAGVTHRDRENRVTVNNSATIILLSFNSFGTKMRKTRVLLNRVTK